MLEQKNLRSESKSIALKITQLYNCQLAINIALFKTI